MDNTTSTKTKATPAWLEDMKFCHVCCDDEGLFSYCGGTSSEGSSVGNCTAVYDGEAICPGCGYPTCPRCAQLAALDDLLDGWGSE